MKVKHFTIVLFFFLKTISYSQSGEISKNFLQCYDLLAQNHLDSCKLLINNLYKQNGILINRIFSEEINKEIKKNVFIKNEKEIAFRIKSATTWAKLIELNISLLKNLYVNTPNDTIANFIYQNYYYEIQLYENISKLFTNAPLPVGLSKEERVAFKELLRDTERDHKCCSVNGFLCLEIRETFCEIGIKGYYQEKLLKYCKRNHKMKFSGDSSCK